MEAHNSSDTATIHGTYHYCRLIAKKQYIFFILPFHTLRNYCGDIPLTPSLTTISKTWRTYPRQITILSGLINYLNLNSLLEHTNNLQCQWSHTLLLILEMQTILMDTMPLSMEGLSCQAKNYLIKENTDDMRRKPL